MQTIDGNAMKRMYLYMIVLLWIAAAGFAGCLRLPSHGYPKSSESARRYLDEAKTEYRFLVQNIAVHPAFAKDVKTVYTFIREATVHLYPADFSDIDVTMAENNALKAIRKSIEIKKAYFDTVIVPRLEATYGELPELSNENIVNLKDKIIDIIHITENIQPVSEFPASLFHRAHTMIDTGEAIRKTSYKLVMDAKNLFPPGIGELTENGKRELERYFDRALFIKKMHILHNQPWTMTIQIEGYADRVAFDSKNAAMLIGDFKKGTTDTPTAFTPPPRGSKTFTAFLNLRLSEIRAQAVSRFFRDLITQRTGVRSWKQSEPDDPAVYEKWEKWHENNQKAEKESHEASPLQPAVKPFNRAETGEMAEYFPVRRHRLDIGPSGMQQSFVLVAVAYGDHGTDSPPPPKTGTLQSRGPCKINSFSVGVLVNPDRH